MTISLADIPLEADIPSAGSLPLTSVDVSDGARGVLTMRRRRAR